VVDLDAATGRATAIRRLLLDEMGLAALTADAAAERRPGERGQRTAGTD
jgi:hypothetical protein